MKRSVIIVDQTQAELDGLCTHIEHAGYFAIPLRSAGLLEEKLESEKPMAVILDTDSILLDNRSLLHFSQKSPGTSILLISTRKIHPELKEAVGQCIYACITKPLDLDEVDFWLQCIQDDVSKPNSNNSF
jgi:DNA-binding NtrC family response regulator